MTNTYFCFCPKGSWLVKKPQKPDVDDADDAAGANVEERLNTLLEEGMQNQHVESG